MKKLLLTKEFPNGKLVDMTAAEIAVKQAEETTWNNGAFDRALEDVRIKRNGLLAETDYVALSDLQGTLLTTEMTNYRQALRDITNGLDTVEKCNNVTWPTKP